jgi:aminoglycoside/choline kinase family phosphotransferase
VFCTHTLQEKNNDKALEKKTKDKSRSKAETLTVMSVTQEKRYLMGEIDIVSAGYRELFGENKLEIAALPQSGSDRKYFRIISESRSVIGAYNANLEENEAFIGFSKHFLMQKLPVPEVYGYLPDKFIYYLQDLGDTNLYTWLHNRSDISDFSNETKDLYRKILDKLILFQTQGIVGLDLELCYPHKSFDRQSMMWDMNYFKYMLLKLLAVPFNERQLERDFNALCDYLLETGQDYFLYRDFQTANVMVIEGEPWFIDYQGGRKGAAQYDVASLLFDAKIPMSDLNREELLTYYIDNFCMVSNEDKNKFRGYYAGFSMIRIMQALGAFGFRGLYEQKPTFTDSIVPGVKLLNKLIVSAVNHINLPELYSAVSAITASQKFIRLNEERK